MKRTDTEIDLKPYIKLLLMLFCVSIFAIYALLCFELDEMSYFVCMIVGPFFMFLYITWGIGLLISNIKGMFAKIKERGIIKKSNPYLYFRYLPNNFGIGVTTLLFDSTIENKKDIIAVILDLCAKKYLSLVKQNNKYVIKILKTDVNNLLDNERYVFNLIVNNNIKNINYNEWYKFCVQDGIELGIYKRRDKYIIISIDTILSSLVNILISLIITILCFVICSKFWSNFVSTFVSLFFFLFCWFYTEVIYNDVKDKNLIKTKKGIEELHKLEAFKAFIKDFGHFVDRRAEEVVLWDYYLAYAQVFGLTKEIMKSGYKELIDNSSFQIDDINNIEFDNIEILL